ncbi:hypothetical protein EIP91_002324 [Steccherinum ochraceum]|uniref:C3HC-type domain-containing protein n=1 Tax=Steccherinum ochraceum TaxID=92696 RepID=A0A4V2MWE6_9APHY|nr:hypothetical protein EIP91_002324 [Steccherinum ochraceum]
MLTASGSHVASTSTTNDSLSTDKNFKRKFEDAIQNLDEATGPLEPLSASAPPSKKARTSHSFYATLAKYGIKKMPKPETSPDKLDTLSKTAPHLAAILARTASRARKALPIRFGHQPTSAPSISSAPSSSPKTASESEYRPSSTPSFLTRLATFKLTTYANKPQAIDAVAAAKCGWINDGKDRLVCGICHVSWVVGGNQGMSRDAANALVEKQRQQLVDMHKDGCPWKTRQCDASIYRVPLYAPVAMARELKAQARKLDEALAGVEIRHPLTASQVQSLVSTMKTVRQPTFSFSLDEPPISADGDAVMRDETGDSEASREVSEPAILTALFGWSILPPSEKSSSRLPSFSRANSVMPSASAPQTPIRLVRVSSRAPSASREGTPSPSPLRFRAPNLFHRGTDTAPSASAMLSTATSAGRSDSALLHCILCQRRIGLWAFVSSSQPEDPPTPTPTPAPETPKKTAKVQPKRQLDILKEHRSYCPYVVRSTEIPTMPLPPSSQPARSNTIPGSTVSLHAQTGALEGWRAVLTVVLRYGASQRQRFGLGRAQSERRPEASNSLGVTQEAEEVPAEVNEVEAMVAGVKTHGGRELLKYVRNLLG